MGKKRKASVTASKVKEDKDVEPTGEAVEEPPSKVSRKIKDEIEEPEEELKDVPASTEAMEDGTVGKSSKRRKKGRKRKKRIYTEVVKQMEFYFSVANIAKSKFMQDALKDKEWMDLSTFLKFNKLVSILEAGFGRIALDDLYSALSIMPSEVIEVRKEKDICSIRRRKPVITRTKEEEEVCTIYVENLPQSATIESVTRLFETFGKVLYVSLPKFKSTQAVKGFAFVEFNEAADAAKALKTVVDEKTRLRPDPAELLSVKTFIQEQAMQEKAMQEKGVEETTATEDTSKESLDAEIATTEIKSKKSRSKKNRQKNGNVACENAADATSPFPAGHSAPVTEGSPIEVPALELSGLHILSKAEWRKLRNTYLNLQRKNMSLAKKKVREYYSTNESQGFYSESHPIAVLEPPPAPTEASSATGLSFEPNVVVRFDVDEPIFDVINLKKKIKAALSDQVKYIDARQGSNIFHVRCANADQAKSLSSLATLGAGRVLAEAEEKDYWVKANADREEKLSGKVIVKKSKGERGNEKIVRKFRQIEELQQHSNSHKFFGDDD